MWLSNGNFIKIPVDLLMICDLLGVSRCSQTQVSPVTDSVSDSTLSKNKHDDPLACFVDFPFLYKVCNHLFADHWSHFIGGVQ